MQYIKGTDRTQAVLFPQSLDEIVDESNEVRIIDLFVKPKVHLVIELLSYRVFYLFIVGPSTYAGGSGCKRTKVESKLQLLQLIVTCQRRPPACLYS